MDTKNTVPNDSSKTKSLYDCITDLIEKYDKSIDILDAKMRQADSPIEKTCIETMRMIYNTILDDLLTIIESEKSGIDTHKAKQ